MDTRKAVLHVGSICLRVAVFVAIVLGMIYLGQTTYRYTRAVFSDEALEEAPGKTVNVKISETVTGKELAEVLETNGLIEDALVFQLQMKMAGFGEKVEADTYELNTSMAPSEMFKILSGADGEDKQ